MRNRVVERRKKQAAEDSDWAHARGDRPPEETKDFEDFIGGGETPAVVSPEPSAFTFSLMPFNSCLNAPPKEERGGRGFQGDVAADVGAFLESDPAAAMMDSDYTASPLVDPRFGSF